MKGDQAYLRHIRDAIARIEAYAAVGKEEFLARSHWHFTLGGIPVYTVNISNSSLMVEGLA